MNLINSLLVIVCFVVGLSFISIEAVNFGIVFFAVAMLVVISGPSGQSGAKAASAPALHGLVNHSEAGAGVRNMSDSFGSNIFHFAIADSTTEDDDAKPAADLMMLKKEFGDDFAIVTAGPAVQAQIDALFSADTDALAPLRASRDADLLAKIVPPHSPTSAA